MANPVQSARDILPAQPYATMRATLKSGDLLFCSGNYLVSQAIRKMTGSTWSHVGTILYAQAIDRVLLLESVEDTGVRLAPLSKYLTDYENGKGYDGDLVIARVPTLQPAQVLPLAAFGTDELTQPYDNGEIAEIVARIALGRIRPVHDRKYICSELVYECFNRAGITFEYNKAGFISPEDVWRDPKVQAIGRIV